MEISYNWLKDYLDLNLDVNSVSQILTSVGLEVEAVEKFETVKGGLEGIVIGHVIHREKHPNADKLSLTKVDVGNGQILDIVCGAPNVDAGQKVVVATVGTTLYKGDESFVIKKAKIRDAVSEGMICAEDEIGLGNSHAGIMVLNENAVPGTPAKEYFNISSDYVFVIGLTPNMIAAASHIGVARDLAAYINSSGTGKIALKKPFIDESKFDNIPNPIRVIVENTQACPRYSGMFIEGVTVAESPAWLQNRLKAIGLRPINNIVDITNYVLHETGQPLHAFDAKMIAGQKVIVKTLAEGTKFVTLDETERTLGNDDLMICNAEEGMCMAGVFGGIKSGVTGSTQSIFLESACFNPGYIRRTAKSHMLSTDSSFRFERGTDPNNTLFPLKRAAQLIKEIAGGKISNQVVDVYPAEIKNKVIQLEYNYVDTLIGNKIERATIENILNQLEIKVLERNENGLKVEIPSYKVDVERPADVVEEILRIYGFNTVTMPGRINASLNHFPKPDGYKVQNIISEMLSANGFNEIMSNSLTKAGYFEKEPGENKSLVHIFNPLSSDLNVMRPTMLYSGLEAVAYNANRRNSDLKMYEFGYCYNMPEPGKEGLKKYDEKFHLALFITGQKQDGNWKTKSEQSDFYYLKAFVENILKRIGVNVNNIQSSVCDSDSFEECVCYAYQNQHLVSFGKVHKKHLKAMDLNTDVYYADFAWDNAFQLLRKHSIEYTELPKFPEVSRDLALLVDKSVKFEEIRNIAYETERGLLKKVSLFDVYEGEKLGADKKSYAVNFILQDDNKTLNDQHIEKVMSKLIAAFETKINAKLR